MNFTYHARFMGSTYRLFDCVQRHRIVEFLFDSFLLMVTFRLQYGLTSRLNHNMRYVTRMKKAPFFRLANDSFGFAKFVFQEKRTEGYRRLVHVNGTIGISRFYWSRDSHDMTSTKSVRGKQVR